MPLKILVADDHELVRSGLRGTLSATFPNCNIVEAENAKSTFARLRGDSALDLVLVDLLLGDMDPFVFLRKLCNQYPDVPVVVVSASENPKHIRKALEIGVAGYVPKVAPRNVLGEALRLVISGGIFVPSGTLTEEPLAFTDVDQHGISNVTKEGVIDLLTRRQLQILKMLAEGKSNQQIADQLRLSSNTVRVHVRGIFKALNLSNRTQAGLFAEKHGLC